MKDMVKFERGQVWMVNFRTPEAVGREKMKDRPYLVLSVGNLSKTFCKISAVPLTTEDEITSPSQVLITNLHNQMNVICCEDIRTFDYTSDNYIFNYMGTLSNEVLEKVDVALSIYLGIHYSPISLKSLYSSIESVVKSIGYLDSQNNSPKFTDTDVQEFADKLASLVTQKPIEPEGEPIENLSPIISNNNPPPKNNDEMSTPRRKWDEATCRKFMDDCSTLPMIEVMKKWDISKKSKLYAMKNYVRALLKKMS